MRIKSTNPESQGAFVEINDADFDPKTMTKYEDAKQPVEAKQPKQQKAE